MSKSQSDSDLDQFSVHKLASIGFVQSFGASREFFFYRRDMSPDSLKYLVEQFVGQMERARAEMVKLLPSTIEEGWKKYIEFKRSPDFQKCSPEKKNSVFGKLKILKEMLSMPVYSWARDIIWFVFYLSQKLCSMCILS